MLGTYFTFPIMSQETTHKAYEEMLGHKLTTDECADAQSNLVGFFAVLVDMERDLYLRQKADEEL